MNRRPNQEWTLHDVEELFNEAGNLSEWEESFLDSVIEQLKKDHQLSDKQTEILDRIHTQKT